MMAGYESGVYASGRHFDTMESPLRGVTLGGDPIDNELSRCLITLHRAQLSMALGMIPWGFAIAYSHESIGEPTIADVLERLLHEAYRFELKGRAMRRADGPYLSCSSRSPAEAETAWEPVEERRRRPRRNRNLVRRWLHLTDAPVLRHWWIGNSIVANSGSTRLCFYRPATCLLGR